MHRSTLFLTLSALLSLGVAHPISAQAKASYYTTNPGIIRVKRTATYFKDAAQKHRASTVHKGQFAKISKVIVENGQSPVLKTAKGRYITANKKYVAKTSGYQNPKRYYQVNYRQIKASQTRGKVGYTVKRNYEGIKTWKIMRRLGTANGYNKYNSATYYAVKNFQRKHHLKVTGNVNEKTWVKLGFSKSSWTGIDSYIAPLKAHAWDGRQAHIEAMIHQAYQYKGKPYLVGSSSKPIYGTDCSGLVMQALYAGGINMKSISSMHHAYPGNEWNSRNMWASKKFMHVAYRHKRRGDLVFYYQPGTHTIWHVAIYLGKGKVIESWPPRIMVANIRNGQRSDIAGIARVFH